MRTHPIGRRRVRGAVASPVPYRRTPIGVALFPAATLLLLALAHLFDFGTFLVMTSRHGLAAELNPVVVFMATEFGLPGLTIAKLTSVVFLAVTAWILYRARRNRVATTLVMIGVVAGIIGGCSNIASI
jgi:hypothetical protein